VVKIRNVDKIVINHKNIFIAEGLLMKKYIIFFVGILTITVYPHGKECSKVSMPSRDILYKQLCPVDWCLKHFEIKIINELADKTVSPCEITSCVDETIAAFNERLKKKKVFLLRPKNNEDREKIIAILLANHDQAIECASEEEFAADVHEMINKDECNKK
jgi:hypothetical protein